MTDDMELRPERRLVGDGHSDSVRREVTSLTFEEVVRHRLTRRTALRALGGGLAATFAPSLALAATAEARDYDGERGRGNGFALRFTPVAGQTTDDVVVPDGYETKVMLPWGESLDPSTPDLDTTNLAADVLTPGGGERQARRVGYNHDFQHLFPLPRGSNNPDHGVLAINHEFTTDELMFPDWPIRQSGESTSAFETRMRAYVEANPETVRVAKAAHGVTLAQLRERSGEWRLDRDSELNRRITADTPIEITGPAAGDDLLETEADPSGREVLGTLNNCAGGVTPWGTLLTCEENFDQYFANGAAVPPGKARDVHTRIPLPAGQSERVWEAVDPRFDAARHPNEAFRFGWVVEIDPYDPRATPKKRTALGRFKHEGATALLTKNRQVVIYSGDDAVFEYVYKYVSRGRLRGDGRNGGELLDDGTLYVARFDPDGTGEWLPLVFGQAPLTPANGFASQAEVLINCRRAGDLLGATPMDRPEDVEPNLENGRIYIAFTNNSGRRANGTRTANGRTVAAAVDQANPRTNNRTGHIVELAELDDEHAGTRFRWEILMLCGDPAQELLTEIPEPLPAAGLPNTTTYFGGFNDPSRISKLGAPDNMAVDRRGNLWIATDGGFKGLRNIGSAPVNDGLFAAAVEGPERGVTRQFLSCPVGAEVCGPAFTSDAKTLFVAIQHPGEGGTMTDPVSTWPDGPGRVPRPAIVAIRKARGSGSPEIGT